MHSSNDTLGPTQRMNTHISDAGSAPDARVLQPGERIGRYRIVAVLGSGGMGEVYRAEQLEPVRRTVALKRLRRTRLDARQLAWFEIERQVLAQMQHPAIAQIYDAGTDADGAPFFAMEYIEGETLLRYCDQHGLGLRARVALLIRVCEGVQHAHQKGIVHRDLKPANILVSTIDGRAAPHIIDFGIATATSRAAAAGDRPEIVGTPDYMSPEQSGLSPYAVDLRSDVYALGVLLYEMLIGQRPGGATAEARTSQRTTLRRPSEALAALPDDGAALASRYGLRPGGLRRTLRNDLDWVTLKAMAPERDARYPSVAAFAEDLRCWLDGRPVSAAPGGRGYAFAKFTRRHRFFIAAAASVVVALLAGLALSLYGLWQADAQRRRAEARERELEQVVAFQQATLKAIDIEAMGEGLIGVQREQLQGQLDRDPQRDLLLGQFDGLVQRLAPADLARAVLDRYVLTGALASIDRDFASQPRVAADLRASAAEVYVAIGVYPRAVELWRAVLETRRLEFGPDALITLRAELGLGGALSLAGDLAGARELQEALYRRGATHSDLPLDLRERIAADYALTLNDQGETAAALMVQTALLERIVAERGHQDPQALKVRNNLAISLVRAGRREDARDHFEAVLAARRAILPAGDPDTLSSMVNVAAIRGELDDFDGALVLQREVYDTLRRQFGDEHARTLSARNNLATTLSRMGRLDEALEHYAVIVERSRHVLGPTHPDTLRWIHNIGAVLMRAGRLDEALPLMREAYTRRGETLGPEHPDTLRSGINLAGLLGRMGQIDDALALAQDNLAQRRRLLGETHRDTIESWTVLARLRVDNGRAREAIDDLRGVLALDVSDLLRLDAARILYDAHGELGDAAGAAALRRDMFDPFLARPIASLDPPLVQLRERILDTLSTDGARE